MHNNLTYINPTVQTPYAFRQPATYQVTTPATRTIGLHLQKLKVHFLNQSGSVVIGQRGL